MHVPAKYVPPNYPNYPQAKFLLQEGVVEPVTRALTIISIIEGFGARIREVKVPDFAAEIKESVDGTAVAHLANGLFEAHARDEAGPSQRRRPQTDVGGGAGPRDCRNRTCPVTCCCG